jgi:hypothetical protein
MSRLPNQQPLIAFNFYQANPYNINYMAQAIKIIYEVLVDQTEEFIQILTLTCVLNSDSTDEETIEYIQGNYMGYYHHVGPSSLGKVVDANFEVQGTEHLAVVDNGINPFKLTAHTSCSSAIIIGENCANKILEAHGW